MAYVKAQLEVLQQIAATGLPLVGGRISAYVWDTVTAQAMYTSSAGAGSATYFTLNSLGQPQSAYGTAVDIFLDDTKVYKFIITDSNSTQVGPVIGPVYPGGIAALESFASMEAVRTSETSRDYIETHAFYAGGTTGGAKLYRSGTGTPTGSGAAVIAAALAAGTFCNAAGNCYKLSKDITITPYMFGCVGGFADDTAFLVQMFNYLESLGSGVAHKYVDWMGGNFGVSAAGGLIDQQGLTLTGVDGVTFIGWAATLKRLDAPTNYNYKPLTVTSCDNFSVVGMSFDMNGSLYFGGFSIYDSHRVRVSKCRFYDSNPGAVTADRYGLGIATSTLGGSEDIEVEGCTFDGLQTEFICRNIRISGNAYKNNVNRAIGLVSGGNSMVRGDMTIVNNTFENAVDDCITIGTDPSSNTGTTITNIVVTGNVVRSNVISGGHFFGCSTIGATNSYRNFTISKNTMIDSVGNPFIRVDSSNNSAYLYDLNVTDNTYVSTAATVTGPVFKFRRVSGGIVSRNQCIGTGIVDAFKFDATGRLLITENIAEATGVAYTLDNTLNSVTGYQEFRQNKWRGAPTTKLSMPNGLNLSDIVEMDDSDWVDEVIVGVAQNVNVAGKKRIRITAAAAASVATFTQAYYGKEIELHFDNANVTINHGTGANNPRLAGAANFVGSQYDTLTLVYHTDGRWREKSRAVI